MPSKFFPSPISRKQARLLRRGAQILGGLAVLWLGYVLVAFLFLPGRLRAIAQDAAVEVEFESVRSWFPGQLSFEDLRVSDPEGNWSASAASARCGINVIQLLGGGAHVTRLRAKETRVELKREPAVLSARRAKIRSDASRGTAAPVALNSAPFLLALGQGTSGAPMIIEDARASGPSLRMDDYELRGQLVYRVERASITEPGASAEFSLSVDDGDLSKADELIGTLSGKVEGELVAAGKARSSRAGAKSKPGSKSSMWQRLTVQADIRGQLSTLSPWLGLGRRTLSLEEATHETQVEFRGTTMQTADIAIQASRALLRHEDGSKAILTKPKTSFVKKGTPSGKKESAKEPLIQAKMESDGLTLHDASGVKWASLEPLSLTMQLPEGLEDQKQEQGTLTLESQRVSLLALNAKMRSRLYVRLPVERVDLEEGSLMLGAGTVRATAAKLDPDGAPSVAYDLSARFDTSAASLSPQDGLNFAGTLHVEGKDGAMLLDMAEVGETARWTLSLLEGRPYTLKAQLSSCHDALLVDRLQFQSAQLKARGAAWSDEGQYGAFLVEGPLPVGARLGAEGITTETPVDEDWLTAHLEELNMRLRASRGAEADGGPPSCEY